MIGILMICARIAAATETSGAGSRNGATDLKADEAYNEAIRDSCARYEVLRDGYDESDHGARAAMAEMIAQKQEEAADANRKKLGDHLEGHGYKKSENNQGDRVEN